MIQVTIAEQEALAAFQGRLQLFPEKMPVANAGQGILVGLQHQHILPLPELVRHAVEGLGELAHIGDALAVVPLGHLLGLPGQVVQVGMDIFQIFAQEILTRWRLYGKVAPGQCPGIFLHLFHCLLQILQAQAQVMHGRGKLRHVRCLGRLRIEDIPKIIKQQPRALVPVHHFVSTSMQNRQTRSPVAQQLISTAE